MLPFFIFEIMDIQIILSVLLGLGLSSAVGFRIFVPALVTCVAAHYNVIELSESMRWMGTVPAIITCGVATLLEIVGYYIPFIDNGLDLIAAPAAAICGTLLMGGTIVEMDPMIKWPISIIAGGGLASTIHGSTSLVRAKSSGFTAGMANPVVSTLEAIVAFVMSIISIILPVFAAILILWLVYKIVRWRKQAKMTS